jgi:hypothetical protein
MRPEMTLRLLPLAAAAAALLSGCGGGERGEAAKPADQIVADAAAALLQATSVHIVGHLHGDRLDEYVGRTGARGRVVTNGLSFRFVRVGAVTYFTGKEPFWRFCCGSLAAAAARRLRAVWVRQTSGNGPVGWLDRTSRLGYFASTLRRHGFLRKAGYATVGGRRAIALTEVRSGTTLYVAAAGRPYPLAMTLGRSRGVVYLEGWDAPFALAAPPHAVDVSRFPGW